MEKSLKPLVHVMTMGNMVVFYGMMVCFAMLIILLPPLPVAAATSASTPSSLRLQSHPAATIKSSSIAENYATKIADKPSIRKDYRSLFEQEKGPKRRKLNDFVVTMSPSDTPFSDSEASTSRDVVEQVVQSFLRTYPSWPEGTSISSVGLVGVKENEYSNEFRSIQLTLGGLIYFTDTSLNIPDEDSIVRTVTKGLMDQDRLLSEIRTTFPFLQSIEVISASAMEEAAALLTPTASPSTGTGSDGVYDDIANDGVSDSRDAIAAASRGDLQTLDSSSSPNIGTLVGSVAGGIGFLIMFTAISIIATRRRRQRYRQTSSAPAPRRMSMSGSSAGGSELIGISIIKDESLHGDRQYSSSYVEDDNTFNGSQTDSESAEYTKRLDVEYDSPKEYIQDNQEMDPPVLGIEKLFAAATNLPSRMLAHDGCGAGDVGDDSSTEPFSELLELHDPGDELRYHECSFDSGSSATGGTSVDLHLLPLPRQQTMESFEHQKRNYNLKKDMMISPLEANYNHPHPQNVHNYRDEPFSALTPTDISATTLAQSQAAKEMSLSSLTPSPQYSTPRKDNTASENDQDITRAAFSSKTPPTPDTIGTDEDRNEYKNQVSDLDEDDEDDPYWSNNGMLSMIGAVWGTAARIRSKDKKGNGIVVSRNVVGADGGRRGRAPTSGGYQSEAETSYEADDLWDPDDMSMSTDDKSGDGLFHASVENRDEQSLLHHSLRNESYKLQRLRTPSSDLPGARHGGSSPASAIDKTTIDGSSRKSMPFSKIFERRRARAHDRDSTTRQNSTGSSATTSMVANTARSAGSPTASTKATITLPANQNLVSPQSVLSSRWGRVPLTQPTMLPQEKKNPAHAPSSGNDMIQLPSENRSPPMRDGNDGSEEMPRDEENVIV